MLNITDGIEDLGGINWRLTACLAAAWVIVFLVLIKGISSLGKARTLIVLPLKIFISSNISLRIRDLLVSDTRYYF